MEKIVVAIVILMLMAPAHAYLGPGMGAGTIAVALGILGSIFLGIFAVIYYPFKRMLKKKKLAKETTDSSQQDVKSEDASKPEA